MTEFGIHDGDLLVVDRSITPSDRSIVIAVLDGGIVVKQLCQFRQGVLLHSGNARHQDILVGSDQELVIWGVVKWSIHKTG